VIDFAVHDVGPATRWAARVGSKRQSPERDQDRRLLDQGQGRCAREIRL